MSKIGKTPIKLPEGVTVDISGKTVVVKGSKGEIQKTIPKVIELDLKDGILNVLLTANNKKGQALHGTWRAILANTVNGVSSGWKKSLELVGTGYRAEVSGDTLILTVGYSHPVKIQAPKGISFKVEKTIVTVEGVDKELVGLVSANIRHVRPPEPYKGKGIKYEGEFIRRKAGKAAKAAGAGA